jgi:nucleotide-binding universal stress UspA family protein
VPAPSPCIVVGYDGSPTARAAVELAARRAAPDGEVIVVNAYSLPADWYGWPAYAELLQLPERDGRALLDGVGEAVPALGDVTWETDLIGGRPASVLEAVAAARQADEIVVGTRGFGAARAMLGSTAHELLHTARRPVTAVPERSLGGAVPADRHDELQEVSR